MSFMLDVLLIVTFFLMVYTCRCFIQGLLPKHCANRTECLFVGCVILFLRGKTPFYSTELQKVIAFSLRKHNQSANACRVLSQRIVAMGISWTLLFGYPIYRFSKMFGATVVASCGTLANLLAYIALSRFSFLSAQCAVFLFALSHTLMLQSHISLAYLFPENSFGILTILGIVNEMSVYGPWYFQKVLDQHASSYFLLMFGINVFCLSCDLLVLPRAEIQEFIYLTNLNTHGKTRIYPSDHANEKGKDSSYEFYSRFWCHERRNMNGWILRIRHAFLTRYAGWSVSIAEVNRMALCHEISCKSFFSNSSRSGSLSDYSFFPRKIKRAVYDRSSDPNMYIRLNVKYDESRNRGNNQRIKQDLNKICKIEVTQQNYNVKIFLLLLGYFMLSFFRKKYLLFKAINLHEMSLRCVVPLAEEIGHDWAWYDEIRTSFPQYFFGLAATGFFYWSVLYLRYGLIPYMLFSNFTAFLAFLCLYFSSSIFHHFFLLFLMIYYSSVSGFPLAAYGALLNWSERYIFFAAGVYVCTGLVSVMCDIFLILYADPCLCCVTSSLEFFLIMTGVGFAAPLVVHLLTVSEMSHNGSLDFGPPHKLCELNRACQKMNISSSCATVTSWICSLRRIHQFIPLFHYFDASNLLHFTCSCLIEN